MTNDRPNNRSDVPSAVSSLQCWLAYLEQLHASEIELGLERVQQVLLQAQLARPARYVITVAGTNGKGSTVSYLDTILRAAGYRVGVYTSPHLQHYNERVSIAGDYLDDARHCSAFAAIEQARGQTPLTYFEFGTLAAFWLMKQQPLDVAILEVGLGGRLDAVNVIDADVAVITSIGIDHVAFLGDNRELIGREKAGIARPDTPLICGDPEPPASIAAQADAIGAPYYPLGAAYSFTEHSDHWHYLGIESNLLQLPRPKLPLINAATALAALETLPLAVSADAIRDGLSKAQLSGRMQALQHNGCDVLLDVAHNAHAAAYIARQLAKRAKRGPIYAVVGMLQDKDHEAVFAQLQGLVSEWFLASLTEPRGSRAEQLATAVSLTESHAPVHCFAAVEEAFDAATQAAQNHDADDNDETEKPLVFAFGSFYTVSRINQQLRS
ncbi:MAG: bifunctional tetrahydrofolate synthase/dihydrofolate synthase [Pseudomonadota bacterium]